MKKSLIACIIMAMSLSACATANRISSVGLGMTRDEVISVMGTPTSISAQGKTVYLNYALSETDDQAFYGVTKPYFVRLVDGKVESFGRTGDFDSTKTPTVRLESDQNIKQDIHVKETSDLYSELKNLKELKDSGVITAEEFQFQKKKILEKH